MQPDSRLYVSQERNTFRTFTGRLFNLAAPTADMVCLEDIAHALAHSTRYNGHLPTAYSVAQHSLHVMRVVSEDPKAVRDYSEHSGKRLMLRKPKKDKQNGGQDDATA